MTSIPPPELVLDAHAELGEGPVWNTTTKRLLWVNILAGEVHSFDPASRTDECIRVGSTVSAVAPRARGGLILARGLGFATLDLTNRLDLIADVSIDSTLRMNDGKCDPSGRLWAGTMAFDEAPGRGALYCLEAGGTPRQVVADVTVSNGLGWSPDGTQMYYIDSPRKTVDVFDFDGRSGLIGNRRVLVSIPPGTGIPDGLAVDEDGFLWVALFGGASICRYGPNGRLAETVRFPTRGVTSCGFGGAALEELYVTTATYGLSEVELRSSVGSGGLFRVLPGVRGLPIAAFAG